MHQALLIDEILQVVLDSSPESSTLSRVARTCQAWKEPALDRLWKRLTSFAPLLMLIPDLRCIDGVYVLGSSSCPDLRSLRSYASRVKHVAHRQKLRMDPTVSELLTLCEEGGSHIFRNLVSIQLSLVNCHPLCLPLSSPGKLESVELDLGFKSQSSQTSNEAVCNYLVSLDRVSSGLTSLSLRGSASQQLIHAVASLSSLKVLSLRLGSTLTVDSILAISTFPSLTDLELHASHIQPADLNFRNGAKCFPSLTKLNVRGCSAFVEKLVQNMQSDYLCSLHADIDPVTNSDDAWISLFSAIRDRTKDTLRDFTIEHHIALEEGDTPSDDTSEISGAPTSETISNNLLRFDVLHPLSNNYNLRRLIFDTTPPIVMHDQDFDQVAKWWPNLEHLDMGTLPTYDSRWAPKVSIKGLCLLAHKLPLLQNLVLPIDTTEINSETVAKCTQHPRNSLQRVTLTSITPPDIVSTVACLKRLFPSLVEVDGTSEHEDHWCKIRNGLFPTTNL